MPETLEAEIVEIDGKPPPRPEPRPEPRGFGDGIPRVLRLDRRWWPLWVLLGGVIVVAGAVFGVVYLIFAMFRFILGLLFEAGNKR